MERKSRSKSGRQNAADLRAIARFAREGSFRAGSNRQIILDLLTREEGATERELYDACAKPGKPPRKGIMTDALDVAAITMRQVVKNGETYWLSEI